MKHKYDIFLGGPWEKRSVYPYKTKIKQAFPNKKIFDPEEQPSQKTGNWFQDNYQAIGNSLTMVAFVPSFPFPGIGPEVGFFYHKNCKGNPTKPLEELVIIWPKIVKPDYAKKVAQRLGYIVENPNEAIAKLKSVLK